MHEITRILNTLADDASAAQDLLPLVYQDLRKLAAIKMAGEAPAQTIQATALVHEAWIKLIGEGQQSFQNRRHFFAVAAQSMRQILIDRARRKKRQKRGAGAEHLPLEDFEIAAADSDEQRLQVHEVLDELATEFPDLAELVKLRFFTGLKMPEIAEVMGISATTAKRHWVFARAWLYERITRKQ